MEKSRNTSKEEILCGQEYLNEKIQHKQFKKNQGPIDLATINDNFIQTENLVSGLPQTLAICVPCQYPSILNSSTRSVDDNDNKNNNDCRIKNLWVKTVTCANHRMIVIAAARKYLNHIHPEIFGSYHKCIETKVIWELYKQLFEIQVSFHYLKLLVLRMS